MSTDRPALDVIENRLLDLTARQVDLRREVMHLDQRPTEDLGIDSLDIIEWLMEIEEHFDVSLPDPDRRAEQVYKEVFWRPRFRVRDMAELIYLRWGTGDRKNLRNTPQAHAEPTTATFTQLSGRLRELPAVLYRDMGRAAPLPASFRRMTDGMASIRIPAGRVEIGSDSPRAGADEQPRHEVDLEAFLIDVEDVSASAYARFLNSIGEVDEETLRAWFLIGEGERRFEHQLLRRGERGWEPVPGAAELPMVLVSWFGAHAYALWANGENWRRWRRDDVCFLPTEAQWEYAARGAVAREWPWGDREPAPGEINAGHHTRRRTYGAVAELPLRPVTANSAVSPFGLRQMAGNVWQWCRDWSDPEAYARRAGAAEASGVATGIRSERGGSWIGSVDLCRSSYRRGRAPHARGRCLGFRCVGETRV
ncbi:MAG: SUMF1/EgtB/PvdO family nonheme iron enzyme [Planctomycetota bacterium]